MSNNIFTINAGRQACLQAGSTCRHHGATTGHAGKFPCIMTLRLPGATRLATIPRNCGRCGLTSASKGTDKSKAIGGAGKVRTFRLAVLNHRRTDTRCMYMHTHTTYQAKKAVLKAVKNILMMMRIISAFPGGACMLCACGCVSVCACVSGYHTHTHTHTHTHRSFDEDSQPHDGQMGTLWAQPASPPSSRSISISSFSDDNDAASSAELGTLFSDREDGSRGSSPDFQQALSPVNQQTRVNSPHAREAARHCIR